MKDQNNEVWVGTGDLNNDPSLKESAAQEFFELPVVDAMSNAEERIQEATAGSSRRDFLKYMGFSLGAATIAAGCETPVRKVIPYVVKPDSIVPGIASYYASSYVDGGDYCSVLVKTREGRPIKIEGNALSSVTRGGTSARVQAYVLGLYDTNRLRGPKKRVVDSNDKSDNPKKILEAFSWENLDKEVSTALSSGNVRIIANTILSPTLKKAIGELTAKNAGAKLVMYDPVSASGMLDANQTCFGKRAVPSYDFSKADVIVSFGADFLGTWISPVEFSRQYAENRTVTKAKGISKSRHIQFENGMSLTGSNADNRILVKPSEQGSALIALYNEVASLAGGASVSGGSSSFANPKAATAIKKTAAYLAAAKGHALVVSGSNDVNEQILVNNLNSMLGSYGSTINFGRVSMQRQGSDKDIQTCLSDMKSGGVDAVVILGANPVYDLPNGAEFGEALAKVAVSVSMNTTIDETTALCTHIAPDHHGLESWGDAEPKSGSYSLVQPTINPLFDTRHAGESFLTWAGSSNLKKDADQPYFEYLKSSWQAMFAQQTGFGSFQGFWDNTLHDGVFEVPASGGVSSLIGGNANTAAGKIKKPSNVELEINFFETVNIGAGQFGNNPWLQEMPDPVNRCVWGNYLSVPVKWDGYGDFDGFKDLQDGDLVTLSVGDQTVTVPVVRQFGQMDGTVSLALGYGRNSTKVDKALSAPVGNGVGVNVYPMMSAAGGTSYSAEASVSGKSGTEKYFSCVQYHHTYGITGIDKSDNKEKNVDEEALGYQGSLTDRSVLYTTQLDDLNGKDGFLATLKGKREHAQHLNSKTLYPGHKEVYEAGHHWGLSVDMNACTGCGACQVACIAENNVPVVGKYEVSRHHEMTWLRIDRYYFGDAENPNVAYQPMMCQHCDNAPCENVCPVAATNHSSEGLNQMTYNRCIGTRYCANNCPYKVRRFNWLDYTQADTFPANEPGLNDEGFLYMADNITRMVLNPDVTVRSRGVIEKCSFCVQRIQEGKLTAKKESRRLSDTDVKTACQTACPTGAIVFGDQNNKNSELSKKWESPLNYFVLEEVNTLPSVGYIAKVMNRDKSFDGNVG